MATLIRFVMMERQLDTTLCDVALHIYTPFFIMTKETSPWSSIDTTYLNDKIKNCMINKPSPQAFVRLLLHRVRRSPGRRSVHTGIPD
jgi:hypothetical protein